MLIIKFIDDFNRYMKQTEKYHPSFIPIVQGRDIILAMSARYSHAS